ncbi:BadF/BadG/BcrA/BcrD ATPase family protein [Bacillus sp. S/N-304-OC-R1]|uniref:BadF/BadG/BcrA/BcrD ATPase family protein n=1 Tax=Bacillus sp. S/N-304-OC-R1 TaxID=2758034 RepID=UPI001C8EBD07|nr:BadF/BadG/BcrA/BcrD ATPase family protein [Bacillus sp. S/N-304-OC-R1]MBY0123334.1 hypothetical protein [Bacillus sp. S/N-304-OC-R1]
MPLNDELFIGIDGGGTKTIGIIGDSKGTIIGSATGASTNIKSRPPEKVKEAIHDLLSELLEFKPSPLHEIKGIFVSTAGGDREEDQERWKQWIFDYGMCPENIFVENDAVGALAAGTKARDGMVLIAGTGSIAYFVRKGKSKPIRAGGWGYLLGDEGSGYDIGRLALQTILRAHDGREEKKEELTESILQEAGLERPEQIITYIYEDPYPRKLIASFAKHVISLAEQGEPNAKKITQEAIHQLIDLAASIIRHEKDNSGFPLVVSGGLFESHYFKKTFEHSMRERGYHSPIILPKYPPVIGSYISALLEVEAAISNEIEQNIEKSWQKVLKDCK